jgi:hypothetical protein
MVSGKLGSSAKTAPTVLGPLINNVHVGIVLEHASVQLANIEPAAGTAVSVTEVPTS